MFIFTASHQIKLDFRLKVKLVFEIIIKQNN